MSRNIYEPNTERRVRQNRGSIKTTRQKPGAFRWWEPECIFDPDEDGSDVGQGCTGEEPPLENGWAQPSPGAGINGGDLEKFAFRLHSDGSLEFKGHLDSSGASSDTVAVTLPGANAGERDFLPANDQFFITTLWDGATFVPAAVYIEAITGELTITFPV